MQRLLPLFWGFDRLAVAGRAAAGLGWLVAMSSSGYDHGTRFIDHGRNMLLAAAILFVVAQVPPQKIMLWRRAAVCAWAWRCWWRWRCLASPKRGAQRWVNVGVVIQPSELLKIAMPLMLAWWFQRREGATCASWILSSPLACWPCRWR